MSFGMGKCYGNKTQRDAINKHFRELTRLKNNIFVGEKLKQN